MHIAAYSLLLLKGEYTMLTQSYHSTIVTEAQILKGYIDWYNSNSEISREELYKSYYGAYWYKPWMEKGQLDKYLVRKEI